MALAKFVLLLLMLMPYTCLWNFSYKTNKGKWRLNGQIQIEILNAVQQLRMTFNNRIKTLTVCDLNSKTTHDNVVEKLRRELYTLLLIVQIL